MSEDIRIVNIINLTGNVLDGMLGLTEEEEEKAFWIQAPISPTGPLDMSLVNMLYMPILNVSLRDPRFYAKAPCHIAMWFNTPHLLMAFLLVQFFEEEFQVTPKIWLVERHECVPMKDKMGFEQLKELYDRSHIQVSSTVDEIKS